MPKQRMLKSAHEALDAVGAITADAPAAPCWTEEWSSVACALHRAARRHLWKIEQPDPANLTEEASLPSPAPTGWAKSPN